MSTFCTFRPPSRRVVRPAHYLRSAPGVWAFSRRAPTAWPAFNAAYTPPAGSTVAEFGQPISALRRDIVDLAERSS
jgi:hypothetical protein